MGKSLRKGIAIACVGTMIFSVVNGETFSLKNNVVMAKNMETITVSDQNVRALGKTFVKDSVLTFSYANSGVEIHFEGSSISGEFVMGQDEYYPQRIAVFVDDNIQPEEAEIITLTQDGDYELAEGLDYGEHIITIRKMDRSYYGFLAAATVGLKNITIDGNLLEKTPEKELSIEVFGDSITNGDAVYQLEDGTSVAYSWMGYVGEVARYFDADLKSCGISGNGLLRSVLSDENGVYFNLFTPQNNWAKLDESATTEAYDHVADPADVVIINLGTNDNAAFSAGQITSDDFYTEYFRFINEIHTDCPEAVVVATLGAMGAEGLFEPIQRAVNDANTTAGETYAYFTELKNCGEITNGKGYDNSHPSQTAHKIYGVQISEIIEDALLEKGVLKHETEGVLKYEAENVVGEMLMPQSITPQSAEVLIDNSGMSGLEAPNHMHASFDSSDVASNGMIEDNMYLGDKSSIIIDLGKKESLGQMYLWNYNDIQNLDSCMKNVHIEYSEDGVTYTSMGTYCLGQSSLLDDDEYGGNVACSVGADKSVDFDGVTGRYVKITPIDNYGGAGYGLSEIRIFRHKTEPLSGDCLTVDAFAPNQLENNTIINAFNNSGLNIIDGTVTSDEKHSNNKEDMLIVEGDSNQSTIALNLDGNYPLNKIKLWNYNDGSDLDIGIKEFELWYTVGAPCTIVTHSTEEINNGAVDCIDFSQGDWKKLGVYILPQATGAADLSAQLEIDVEGVRAQHIKIVPKSNYSGTNDKFGLGEVKVYVDTGWATEYSREWTGVLSSSGTFAYQGNTKADNKGSSLLNSDNGRGWIGGDGFHTTSLNGGQLQGDVNSDSKTLFTFQDSFEGNFGNYDGFGYEHGYGTVEGSGFSIGMRNHAYMMLEGDEPDVRNIQMYMQLENGISDSEGYGGNIYPGQYWLADSTVVNGNLYTIANKFVGLVIPDADFYKSPLESNGFPSMTSIPELVAEDIGANTEAVYHESIYEEGDYLYLYGKKENKLVVSRILASNYESLTGFTYWNGTEWVSNPEEAAAISSFMPGNEFNVTKITEGTFAGKYMLVHTAFSITGSVCYALADSPVGPFVEQEDSQMYWATEKYKLHMRYYPDKPVIFQQWNYNAKSQPAISKTGELLITYHFGIHDDQENRVPFWGYFYAVEKEYEHPTFIKMFDVGENEIVLPETTTEEPTTETGAEKPTTEAGEEEPTTETGAEKPTTEVRVEEPTTGTKVEEPTTETKVEVATVVKSKVKAPARAEIRKVAAKKQAAKTVKVTLKKMKGVAGYQIQISRNKKFTLKSILAGKYVKKTNLVIRTNKIKNKKKLYVRARAYILDGNGNKVYGKWSKVKKIKVQ